MVKPRINSPDCDPPSRTDIERAWSEGVRNGDAEAFEKIFRAYNRQLYQFALSLLRSADDAEDTVQAVFVAIWEHRASWSVHSSLRVYLFTAVRNRAFERLRGIRTRDRLQDEVFTFKSRFLSAETLTPDEHVQQQDFAAALDRAVQALPPRMREAFLLTRDHEMTYEEAAALMGVSAKTVMTHIGRALAALRKALRPLLVLFLAVR